MERNLAEIFGITPIAVQLALFAVSFFIGTVMIGVYTAYSAVIDKRNKHKSFKRKFIFSVSDIMFWINMSLIVFAVYYKIDNAQIRLYYFIFILCGMITAYNVKLKIIKRKKELP